VPKFEVTIPAISADLPMDVKVRVEAESWLAALKVGLEKICGAQMSTNVLCDIGEDGAVHVTDPTSGKVFRIVELDRPAPTPAAAPAPPAKAPPPRVWPAPEPVAPPAPAAPGRAAGKSAAAPASRAAPVVQAPPPAKPAPAKPRLPPRPSGRSPQELQREKLLEEVFLRVSRLAGAGSRDEGLGMLLDLALEKVACESAFALLARGDRLAFAAGRGLKAAETLKAGVALPLHGSIAGFCAREVVSLAVSDVERDPRFFRGVHEAVAYPTRSMLVCPIVHQGRVFGALQLKNKKTGPFDAADLAVLAYLSHHAATFLELQEAMAPFEAAQAAGSPAARR